jgi:hypothetical protein
VHQKHPPPKVAFSNFRSLVVADGVEEVALESLCAIPSGESNHASAKHQRAGVLGFFQLLNRVRRVTCIDFLT